MNNAWYYEFRSLTEILVGAPPGTSMFSTVTAIAVGTLLIFGWVIVNFVCSARKGIAVSFLALCIPAIAGIIGWIAVNLYLSPHLKTGSFNELLPVLGATFSVLLADFFSTRKLLSLSMKGSIFALVLSYACVTASIFLSTSLIREMDTSLASLEYEKEKRENDTNYLLNY